MTKDDGRSKGFGFVCFSSPDEANTALSSMNGRVLGDRPLYVSLAERKDDRKARLIAFHLKCNANTVDPVNTTRCSQNFVLMNLTSFMNVCG